MQPNDHLPSRFPEDISDEDEEGRTITRSKVKTQRPVTGPEALMQSGEKLRVALIVALWIGAPLTMAAWPARAEAGLNASDLVEIAIESNPQIHSMHAQWQAAQHQILQNYAPADPIFTYSNVDSSKDFNAATHAHAFTENFQFPGKALFQVDQAKTTANIARLAYEAALRDLRAAVETGYYQVLLDDALIEVNGENLENLGQVVKVTETAYSGGEAAQSDVITAEVNLAQAQLLQRQYQVSKLNDETTLNQLIYRDPGSPLDLERTIHLERVTLRLQTAVDMAYHARQEILEAALSEKNQDTAVKLAKFEYLPDYSVGYEFDYFLQPGAQPLPNVTQAHTWTIGFNMPIFFWIHQREDVKSAEYSLDAARSNLRLIRSQTAATVTQIYSSMQFAYESAELYRDSLIPLANQDFTVALIAYQARKIDFIALSVALQASYSNRINLLQASNQFFAGEVSLEQAIGAPLPK
jgi:outer membrane protein, heavy metal efflux system